MGITSSKSSQHARYGLCEQGLRLDSIKILHQDAPDAENAPKDPIPWLEVTKSKDDGLQFNVKHVPGAEEARQLAFVCDPKEPVQGPQTSMLRISRHKDEIIHAQMSFSPQPQSTSQVPVLSIACVDSPEDLDRFLQERKRVGLQRHPALTVIEDKADSQGHLTFSWTPSSEITSKPGRKYCSILSYQPASDSFVELASMAFWLEVLPAKTPTDMPTPQLLASLGMHSPPSPRPQEMLSEKRSSFIARASSGGFLSPRPQSDPKRNSYQALDRSRKRISVQSVPESLRSVSPSSDSNQYLAAPVPVPQRTVSSPEFLQAPLPSHAKVESSPLVASGSSQSAGLLPCLDEFGEMPPDDGPLFRASLKAMEDRTHDLRKSLKHVLKEADIVHNIAREHALAEDSFDRALHQLAQTNPNSIQPLYDSYWEIARKIQGFARKEKLVRLEDLFLEPVRRMVSLLKTAEVKKKTFEQESKAFYDHLNRYLSTKNEAVTPDLRVKANHADEKHKGRRDRFTIARLDYFNALRDLALFKECSTLTILSNYAHAQHDIVRAVGSDLRSYDQLLDDLDLRLDALSAEVDQKKMDIEIKRRALETSLALHRPENAGIQKQHLSRASVDAFRATEQTLQLPNNRSNEALSLASSPNLTSSWPSPPHPVVPEFDSLEEVLESPISPRRKEGFLWANARPLTHQTNPDTIRHWNKCWVVVAGGQLSEYADDRLDLNNSPINLRFATVRQAKLQDRRFTFEVITPSLRRVYQATSAEELQGWMTTITNVIQSCLDGTSSVRHFVRNGSPHDLSPSNELGTSGGAILPPREPASESKDGVKGMFARLNKPLQRRSSAKHSKRESVSAIVANLAANVRRKDRDPGAQLATLAEASQSMTSFFSSDQKQSHPAGHPKYASAHLDSKQPPTTPIDEREQFPERMRDDLDHSIEAAVQNTFGPPMTQTSSAKTTKASNARAIQLLSRQPENRRCADCNSPDPRWASWNHGIFLCIRCSGIHRGLGSHISKVRSVDLDEWSDEQLQRMKDVGNKAGRSIWEPPDLPAEMRSDEQISQLIKMKYVEKRWHNSELLQQERASS